MPEKKQTQPGIIEIISETLSKNLTLISGESLKVKVENLGFDVFKPDADKIKAGRSLSVYTESNRALMTIMLPDEAQKIFYSKFSDTIGKQKDAESLTKLLNLIAGNLPYLSAVKENGDKSSAFTIQKPYIVEFKDHLLWDTSECNVFKCSAVGTVFYINLNIELQKLIENILKADPAFIQTLRQRLGGNKVSEEGVSSINDAGIRVKVKNPLEFIIGSCFLPREAYLGKKDVSVVFNEIIATRKPASLINDGMIWYRFWIFSGGAEYSIFYSVDVKGQQKKYAQFFNRLFTDLIKQTAVFLRGQAGFERVKGKIISPPAAADIDDSIILNADINWDNKRIMTRVFAPKPFFTGYLSGELESWEVDYLNNNDFSVLLFLLSLNSTLFGKNIDNFYRQTGSGRPGHGASAIGVSKILAILDTFNASRLVQNYFLATGGSLDEFQALFLYQYKEDGEDKVKVGRDALFNKEEYKRFIPKALHSDWELCNGTSASYEELTAQNEKALRGIYSAIQEDKLLMPYKVSFILYNEFQKPMDERFKAEIKRLVDENPWPALLEIIPKKTGQQAVSAIPSSKLGTALVPGKPEINELAHLMSKTKRQELEDEVRINTKKYEKGNLEAEKVFAAMKELLDILEELAAPDDEMI